MNRQLLGVVLVLIAALVIGLTMFRQNNANDAKEPTVKETKTSTTEVNTDAVADTTASKEEAPVTSNETLPEPTNCGGDAFDLKAHLDNFSANIEAQKIMYKSQELSDCSGMFLRVCNSLRDVCSDYSFPDPSQVKDTRLLARWYHEKGNFTMIKDARTVGSMIRPGAVMFFGQQGQTYTDLNIDKLAAQNTGIEHMGTVTDVTKDEEGNVIEYTMFHGRSTGKIAQRTKHRLNHTNPKYFPFGNWDQQLVGIGYIMTPKEQGGATAD